MADDPVRVPQVVVLAGANGSGKTTSARTILAETLNVMPFVNADVIAQGLAGFEPASAAIEASRIMLERLRGLAERRADFAFETTLAARTYAPWLRQLRQDGYFVRLVYVWLSTPDLNVARVALRVRSGGHNVPESTIRQRYVRSVRNFLKLYRPIANEWQVFDNSEPEMLRLIAEAGDVGERILLPAVWQQFLRSAGNE